MGYMEESKAQSGSKKLFPIFEAAKKGFVTPAKSQPSNFPPQGQTMDTDSRIQ